MGRKRRKLRGTVEKIIRSPLSPGKETAQINIKEADVLYREIRVENVLEDDEGSKERRENGEEVDVILESENDPKRKPD